MTISSLIVECAPEACDAVAAELSARDGVEVHGIDAKQGPWRPMVSMKAIVSRAIL